MRSIWDGSVSFGLVSIPIKMYSGSEFKESYQLANCLSSFSQMVPFKGLETGLDIVLKRHK